MELITANLSGKSRRDRLQGREYLVVPLSLLVPGVLNGSQGPLYYPPEEVSKNPGAWNGVPILVDHPSLRGQPVSARDPDVLNRQWIGYVFRSKAKGKLTAEGWFDREAVERVDNRVMQLLESGQQIELSTGLLTDNERVEEGTVTEDGKPYSAIARNYRPDHLAILPDQIGACSVDDGCGVNVNVEGLSHDDLQSLLGTKLAEKLGSPSEDLWISEVFDDYFIYRQDKKLFRLGYASNKDEVVLSDQQPVEVKRVTTFEPVTNTKGDDGMSDLTKEARKKIVEDLIANSCCWDEADREVLNGLDDGKLGQLKAQSEKDQQRETVLNAATKGFTDPGGNAHTYNEEKGEWETKPKKDDPVINKKEDKPLTPEEQEKEWMGKAPARVKASLAHSESIINRERAILIEQLTVNVKDDEGKQRLQRHLESKPLEELHELMALAPEAEEPRPVSYAGAAGAVGNRQASDFDESDVLPLPVMNFEEEEKQVEHV